MGYQNHDLPPPPNEVMINCYSLFNLSSMQINGEYAIHPTPSPSSPNDLFNFTETVIKNLYLTNGQLVPSSVPPSIDHEPTTTLSILKFPRPRFLTHHSCPASPAVPLQKMITIIIIITQIPNERLLHSHTTQNKKKSGQSGSHFCTRRTFQNVHFPFHPSNHLPKRVREPESDIPLSG